VLRKIEVEKYALTKPLPLQKERSKMEKLRSSEGKEKRRKEGRWKRLIKIKQKLESSRAV
jgi:hypothetical protein